MIDEELLNLLVCPLTRKPLRYDRESQELISDAASLAYPVKNGVPILIIDRARTLTDQTKSP
jgi:uncharacterized protein